MKKIKYILFAAIIMLSFNLIADAKNCTYIIDTPYTYGESMRLEEVGLNANSLYIRFGNYILDKKGLFSGNGNEYAQKFNEMLQGIYRNSLAGNRVDRRLLDLVLNLNLESLTAGISNNTYDYKTGFNNKGKMDDYMLTIKDGINVRDSETCPSAVLINHDSAATKYQVVEFIYSDDYIDFEDDIAKSSFDSNSLIAISTDKNNGKSYYEYYNGRACSLQSRYSSNLNYGSVEGFDISAIVKKYQLENLNVKEVDEMLNSKGFDPDNALSIQQFSDRYGDIVKNFIIHDYLISDIEKDIVAIDTFREKTAECINKYYNRGGEKNDSSEKAENYYIDWYEKYDKDSNERYAKTLGGFLQLVINAYENISIDDKQVLTADDEINACGKDIFEECNSSDSACSCQCAQIILNSNDLKYNDAKEYINNQCRGIQDTTAEERCKKGAAEGWCKKNPTSITCEEANNIENQFLTCQCSAILLNSNDSKYNDAKNYINNRCRGIQDTTAEETCRKGAAESYLLSHPSYCTKSDVSDVQDNAEKIINDIMERGLPIIYEYAGIDINGTTTEGLCTILYDKENGLGDYIGGGLNLTRIVGPILVIVLTGLDAMKSIASQKEDEIRKFWNHIKIRLICLALLFLVPTIVNFLLDLVIKEGLCQIK